MAPGQNGRLSGLINTSITDHHTMAHKSTTMDLHIITMAHKNTTMDLQIITMDLQNITMDILG